MTQNEYNKAVAGVITLIVKNNAGAVARALRKAGYVSKYDKIPESEMESQLLKLNALNREKFFQVMNDITWNYGDTQTNKPEIRDRIMGLVKMNNPSGNTVSASRSDWWATLLNILHMGANSQPPAPVVTTTTNVTGIIALSLLGIGMLIGIIILIK